MKKESSYYRSLTIGKNVEKTKEKSFVPKLSISGDGNLHDSSVSESQGEDGEYYLQLLDLEMDLGTVF